MFVRLVWCVLASEKNGPKKLTRQEILRDTRLHRYNTHLIVLLHFEFLSHSKRAIPYTRLCAVSRKIS